MKSKNEYGVLVEVTIINDYGNMVEVQYNEGSTQGQTALKLKSEIQ